ncbi:MAG: D-alanyl-D-alanine dipeptidase [Alphaproteobacteria bacterium]|nr:D-alanyl-D-alanine dipeptidase [Alphaproteobacteria bacterium]
MDLHEITEQTHDVILDLRYATTNNFVGEIIYDHARCFLHQDAIPRLEKAIILAARQGFRLKIFDAFRPQRSQEKLWAFCPNPDYVMDPAVGSNHTRGLAIDLTLVDPSGSELDMGTPFDDFTTQSRHGAELLADIGANRYLLVGIMVSAGWGTITTEWWHYQLPGAKDYPLIMADPGLMG